MFRSRILSLVLDDEVEIVSLGAKLSAEEDENPFFWLLLLAFGMVKAEDEEVAARSRKVLKALIMFV